MSELRWNPLLGTWTMVAANRQNRPNMPENWCPFCPGEGKKVPEDYDVLMYPNDFPALSGDIFVAQPSSDILYASSEASGACEVILYSPDHFASLAALSENHLFKLVQLWTERTAFHQKNAAVKYVFVFENRGAEVGVTMPHPHGQLYAYPFIPLKISTELKNAKAYFEAKGTNLFSDMLAQEQLEEKRIVFENESFTVFLPYFTDYPYGVFVMPKFPCLYLTDMTIEQQKDLGITLKNISGMFDALFDRTFPYMMCMHQGAINDASLGGQEQWYRFHIEYYPPLRAANAIKYYASSEMGAWAAANTRAVEDTAVELKNALTKFLQS